MTSGFQVYVSKVTMDKLEMFRESEDDSRGTLVRRAVDTALARSAPPARVPQWKQFEEEEAGVHDY